MKIRKQLLAVSLAVCLAFGMGATVSAARQVPDTDRAGSISITMRYGEKTVSGGTLTLYRAGGISEDDGNYSFVLTEDYKESGISLDDLESAGLAESLAKYTSEKKPAGVEIPIGKDGKASAAGLETGLYLIVQTKAAEGYEAVSPFLVSIPMNEDGVYLYDVNATPKMGTLTEEPPEPDTPAEPNLPQTGQLNWPVPVMAAAGLALLLLGFGLRMGKKGAAYET